MMSIGISKEDNKKTKKFIKKAEPAIRKDIPSPRKKIICNNQHRNVCW